MSTTEKSPAELIKEIREDPDAFLRDHQDRLRKLRRETDRENFAALIDAILDEYDEEGGE